MPDPMHWLFTEHLAYEKTLKKSSIIVFFQEVKQAIMELLISKGMYEIPIPLLIRSNSSSFNYEYFIRKYHVYMKVWSPVLGVCLFGKKEPSNGVDKNAVAVIRLNSCGKKEVVGHVPRNISKVVSLYLCPTLLPGT